MSDIRTARRYAQAITGRMAAEDARDWSDAELERCLSGCVAGPRLVALARIVRDCNLREEASHAHA